MPTIAEQLTQLTKDRDDLVDNLTTKGITGLTGDETFTELVPEVLNIPSGEDLSEYFGNLNVIGVSTSSLLNNSIKKIPNDLTIQNDATGAFLNCRSLLEVPLLDTSNVTNMGSMFRGCYSLTTIPQFNTSKVTNMGSMFTECNNLASIPLLNTSNVLYMNYMFSSCRNISTIPLLDTSNVIDMGYMFSNSGLREVPQLNTSKVTNMRGMFNNCSVLTTVPLLDTSSLSGNSALNQTFTYCRSLNDDSLNNILRMCINATGFTGTKTLAYVGLTSSYYPASRIQALSNYQDFIDAGWTIGY